LEALRIMDRCRDVSHGVQGIRITASGADSSDDEMIAVRQSTIWGTAGSRDFWRWGRETVLAMTTDPVGWAEERSDVPTIYHRSRCEIVLTLRSAHPTAAVSPHNSRAFENANELTRRVFSSRMSVRVIGGSARWLQFSRSQSRQLTPIGVPSAFSKSIPAA
jgi:hypothetical protein